MKPQHNGHRVRLVIPTDRQADIAPIIGRIIGRWNGCTVTTGHGWWADSGGKPVKDTLSVLECSIGVWDVIAREWFESLADVVRDEWGETCVFLSVVPESAFLVFGEGNIVPVFS